MTRIFILLIIMFSFANCNNTNQNNKNKEEEKSKIQFYEETHDFGIVIEGEKVVHKFKFKNIGKGNLIIKNAHASCGCTIPSFSNEPIEPGNEGEIELVFNSEYRIGKQTKNVMVWTNSQKEPIQLSITCNIVEAKQ